MLPRMCHVGSEAMCKCILPSSVPPSHCLDFVKIICNSSSLLQQRYKSQQQDACGRGCCRYNEIRCEFYREAATLDMPPRDSIMISRISLIAQVSLVDCK